MALALRARVSLACRDVASVSVFVFGASGLVERGANRRRGGVGDAESVLRLAPRVEVVSVVGEGFALATRTVLVPLPYRLK